MTEREQLPERLERVEHRLAAMEGQIAQLRLDMASEFSATRQGLRAEMRTGFREVRGALDERWYQTLALHEDIIERITRIGE